MQNRSSYPSPLSVRLVTDAILAAPGARIPEAHAAAAARLAISLPDEQEFRDTIQVILRELAIHGQREAVAGIVATLIRESGARLGVLSAHDLTLTCDDDRPLAYWAGEGRVLPEPARGAPPIWRDLPR